VLQLADRCLTPWAWASGVHEQAVEDLVPFLVEHGVPHEHAQSRAQAAVSAIGATYILGALASKIPQKQLKTLGNQVKFQSLLPAELTAKIQKSAGSASIGKPKGSKRKPKAGGEEKQVTLDPSKLCIPEGTFAAGGTNRL